LEPAEFFLRADGEVLLTGLDRVDVDAILGCVFGLSRNFGVQWTVAKEDAGLIPVRESRVVSCLMYTSLSLDTGPVCDISAYLYLVALGSISMPRWIGQVDRRGSTGVYRIGHEWKRGRTSCVFHVIGKATPMLAKSWYVVRFTAGVANPLTVICQTAYLVVILRILRFWASIDTNDNMFNHDVTVKTKYERPKVSAGCHSIESDITCLQLTAQGIVKSNISSTLSRLRASPSHISDAEGHSEIAVWS